MSARPSEEDLFRTDSLALDLQVLGEIELLGSVTGVDLVSQLSDIFLADARLRVIELRRTINTGDALETKSTSISPMLSVRLLEAIESEVERVQSAFDARIGVTSTQTGVADERLMFDG
jgi:hypothetical protein